MFAGINIDDEKLLQEAIEFSDKLWKEPILKCYHLDSPGRGADAAQAAQSDSSKGRLIYPLDGEIRDILVDLKSKIVPETKELSYEANDTIDKLWELLIEKAIICLRIFDKREPFLSSSRNKKHQYVYGIDKLKKYHDKYINFEGVLYGSDFYYRDHVFHVIRVWLLGLYLLLTENSNIRGGENEKRLIDKIHFEGESANEAQQFDDDAKKNLSDKLDKLSPEDCLFWRHDDEIFKIHEDPNNIGVDVDERRKSKRTYLLSSVSTFSNEINIFEKISMWTIIALCHDLGYPLEKSKKVLERTEEMMEAFVSNPYIEKSLRFDGTQDSNNLDIITFACKKMKPAEGALKLPEEGKACPASYKASIQDKYRFKYKLSLEEFSHGIISAIIIYKMLIYFIETDNNPDANYVFHNEDARQFYIRRDILRAITSHTCQNVYHIDVPTFPMLLFVCDELQEWGRKSWRNMYIGVNGHAAKLTLSSFNSKSIKYKEDIQMPSATDKQILDNIERIIKRQYILYFTTFRDGQYTAPRQFNFTKQIDIEINKQSHKSIANITIEFSIYHDKENEFCLKIHKSGDPKQPQTERLAKNISDLIGRYKDRKYGSCKFVNGLDEGGTQK